MLHACARVLACFAHLCWVVEYGTQHYLQRSTTRSIFRAFVCFRFLGGCLHTVHIAGRDAQKFSLLMPGSHRHRATIYDHGAPSFVSIPFFLQKERGREGL